MYWLRSTTRKTWTALGKTIPDADGTFLALTDSEYAEIQKVSVIKSLIDNGYVIVFDKEPSEIKNSLNNLQVSNAQLLAQNEKLQGEVEALKANAPDPVDIEAIKVQAQEEIKQQAVQELQEKQDALDAANAKLAQAQKELEALKKKAGK